MKKIITILSFLVLCAPCEANEDFRCHIDFNQLELLNSIEQNRATIKELYLSLGLNESNKEDPMLLSNESLVDKIKINLLNNQISYNKFKNCNNTLVVQQLISAKKTQENLIKTLNTLKKDNKCISKQIDRCSEKFNATYNSGNLILLEQMISTSNTNYRFAD